MLILRKIAVTGGLASGKSTVCRFLKECGGYVVDADAVVHRLLSPETSVGQQVISLLGLTIVVGNRIDRKKIAQLVFSNREKLHGLEAILHPAVKEEIETEYNQVKKNSSYSFFVAEIPLLYEAKMEKFFDTVIAVVSDPALAKNRFSGTDFEERIARQETTEAKAIKADFTLVNNGDVAALKQAVFKLASQLTKGVTPSL